jgi:15-cis-phytoene synthase
MAKHARTFRFATRFLPTEYRQPTLDLYAFFRTLDDLVDESDTDEPTILAIHRELDDWQLWFERHLKGTPPRVDIGSRLREICNAYAIPETLFLDFLEGLRSDLHPVLPADRADVERYSYQVASTVGIAMAHVFGATSHTALDAATRLGIAMQLTNIVRDVGGDLERGRIYLPQNQLLLHGLNATEVITQWKKAEGPDERLISVITTMIEWADDHYDAGLAGVRMLPEDVRMPILIAGRLYQQILRQLESNNCDSLRTRVATSRWQKAREAYRATRPYSIGGASNVKDTRAASTMVVSGNEQDSNAR